MYKVIHTFKDLKDEAGKVYREGDTYPRKGYKPTEKRIAELLGKRNKIGAPLIKEIEASKKKTQSKPKEPKKRQPAKKAGA